MSQFNSTMSVFQRRIATALEGLNTHDATAKAVAAKIGWTLGVRCVSVNLVNMEKKGWLDGFHTARDDKTKTYALTPFAYRG